MSLNKVELIGRLGADPELETTPNGTKVCRFSLATNERWKDGDGNVREHTEWHDVVAFAGLAEVCAQHLRKGRQVFIEGRLRYEKGRKGSSSTSIYVNQLVMLGSAPREAPEPVEEEVPF